MCLCPVLYRGSSLQDKDGISAAVAFTQMAARLAAEGTTVSQHLAALQQRYGTFVGRQSYFVAERPAQSAAVFDGIRSGGNYPKVSPAHSHSAPWGVGSPIICNICEVLIYYI